MKKTAFTLIELLVVVSIIAILASLAIPAFSKVMEKGRSVQDANNLKQLGLGIAGYTNDNSDSYFPTGSGVSSWPALLNGGSGTKYVPLWKIFQSPFDNKRAPSETGTSSPGSPISYDVNKNLMGASTSDVASPSNCILMSVFLLNNAFARTASQGANFFGKLTSNSNQYNSQPYGVFSSGLYMNVLFADSHVTAMRASDFGNLTNPVTATSGSPTDLRWNQ